MRRRNKLITTILALVMVLPLFLGLGSAKKVEAATEGRPENEATLYIHKKKMLNLPKNFIQNTGEEMDGTDGLFSGYDPLPGVTFTVYDATQAFYENYKATGSMTAQEAALAAVKGMSASDFNKNVGTGITNDEGETSIDVSKTSDKQNAVYLIIESPKDGVTVADNLVVAFPVYKMNADGTYTNKELNDIHLYPKNVVSTDGALKVLKAGSAKSEPLNGAKFVISRETDTETQYITGASGGLYTWASEGAYEFETGKSYAPEDDKIASTPGPSEPDGILNVVGLEVGAYKLIETAAPGNAGMIANETEKDFTITADTTAEAPIEITVLNDTTLVKKTTPQLNGKDVAVGTDIAYEIAVNIPLGIRDKVGEGNYYKQFILTDTHDVALDFNDADQNYSLVIRAGETAEADKPFTGRYTVKSNGNSFTVTINPEDIPVLEPGKTLVFKYTMKLNANADPDKEFKNSVTVDTGHTVGTDDTEVTTGGKRFVKVDEAAVTDSEGKDSKVTLAGAVFIVRRGSGADAEYLQFDDTTNAILWGDKEGAYDFTTGKDGLVDIRGLAYGDYTLIETKAPDGYVLPANPETPFTVSKGSYGSGATLVDPAEVPNKHKGSLPSTGGSGIVAFVLIGVVAVGGAVLYFTKGRRQIEG